MVIGIQATHASYRWPNRQATGSPITACSCHKRAKNAPVLRLQLVKALRVPLDAQYPTPALANHGFQQGETFGGVSGRSETGRENVERHGLVVVSVGDKTAIKAQDTGQQRVGHDVHFMIFRPIRR